MAEISNGVLLGHQGGRGQILPRKRDGEEKIFYSRENWSIWTMTKVWEVAGRVPSSHICQHSTKLLEFPVAPPAIPGPGWIKKNLELGCLPTAFRAFHQPLQCHTTYSIPRTLQHQYLIRVFISPITPQLTGHPISPPTLAHVKTLESRRLGTRFTLQIQHEALCSALQKHPVNIFPRKKEEERDEGKGGRGKREGEEGKRLALCGDLKATENENMGDQDSIDWRDCQCLVKYHLLKERTQALLNVIPTEQAEW